jgi:integrase
MLLLDAGLRLGEAIALRWKDVVFDATDGRLLVRKSFSRGKHMGSPEEREGARGRALIASAVGPGRMAYPVRSSRR